MKAASSAELKAALKGRTPAQLTEICLRLARFKKENKELLTYLLFEADDLEAYLRTVREEIAEGFIGLNRTTPYFTKKGLRKILRVTNKYIRYTGSKTAEAELLIFFCQQIRTQGIPLRRSTVLQNLYDGQLKKARAAVAALHEDLQYEYMSALELLEERSE
ncbi:MAG TPA: hypothetical protein VHK69_16330 [Chitinophagaceae bacterium]|jgi:hypothetical protein|nr:hypothetical protein [Chitinophagaceae bacterium]